MFEWGVYTPCFGNHLQYIPNHLITWTHILSLSRAPNIAAGKHTMRSMRVTKTMSAPYQTLIIVSLTRSLLHRCLSGPCVLFRTINLVLFTLVKITHPDTCWEGLMIVPVVSQGGWQSANAVTISPWDFSSFFFPHIRTLCVFSLCVQIFILQAAFLFWCTSRAIPLSSYTRGLQQFILPALVTKYRNSTSCSEDAFLLLIFLLLLFSYCFFSILFHCLASLTFLQVDSFPEKQ